MHKPLGLVVVIVFLFGARAVEAADQPQWGHAWTRNLVSNEKGLPDSFDIKAGTNVKWVAKIGNETHSTPVIANGRVYIGTNNAEPRDPKHQGDRGVMMCFDEKTGALLWQFVVPKREEDRFFDWPNCGISSPATVEGDRVYFVNNRGEVTCLDVHGLANGNDGPFVDEGKHMTPRGTNAPAKPMEAGPLDADVVWLFDMTAGAGIWSHDGAHSSVLIHGDFLYLNSGTGVDSTHKKIRTPDAPSLVVIDKKTGRYVARDDERMAPNIFHCTWSSPSMAEVNGRPLIFFCGGNGIVYAFEPVTKAADEVQKLKKVWQFDFDPMAPKENVHLYNQNRRESPSNFYGMPVFHGNRLYVAGGGDIFWGKNEAWLKCIDPAKTGDVSGSAEVWSYTLEKHVLSTPAVLGELTFIADCGRKFHCLETRSGKAIWTHDIKGDVWASPYVADGKVYLGTRSGSYYIFGAAREKVVLAEMELVTKISATATAANGVLYVATMSHLYALQAGGKAVAAVGKED